ncbi:MAG: hypothetical protein BWY76_03291 [bacterium ADurb.Bin429]|nr:MAG: hypothetical protein BWY76_03291 [bacterium ADurb.Bin429]
MMNIACSPLSTKRWNTMPSTASTPRLTATSPQATHTAARPKKTGASTATTAIRAVQGISGASRMVSQRARFVSMMRDPRIAGTLQPKPSSNGRKLLPCSPIVCIKRSVM